MKKEIKTMQILKKDNDVNVKLLITDKDGDQFYFQGIKLDTRLKTKIKKEGYLNPDEKFKDDKST